MRSILYIIDYISYYSLVFLQYLVLFLMPEDNTRVLYMIHKETSDQYEYLVISYIIEANVNFYQSLIVNLNFLYII